MRRLSRRVWWTLAVVASLAALGVLAALIVSRRTDTLGVALALVFVLLAMNAGVSIDAARERRDDDADALTSAGDQPPGGLGGVDADTLEAMDRREMLRMLAQRRQQRD